MRNHTLMQTIARANRVLADKVNGLIVDYIGIFRNLQQALAIFDILKRPSPSLRLTKAECEQVKALARELLDTLKAERLAAGAVGDAAGSKRAPLCWSPFKRC